MATAFERVQRYEDRMRRDGFVKKHVWVPRERVGEFETFVERLREETTGVRSPALKRIVARLRCHRDDLEKEGIASLSLFGSYARGEETADSDLDIAVDFVRGRRPSLVDLSRLRRLLNRFTGLPVDVVRRSAMTSNVRKAFERDAIRVL